MGTEPQYVSAMRSTSIDRHAWAGRLNVPDAAAQHSVAISNNAELWNTSAIIVLTPQDASAAVMVSSTTGVAVTHDGNKLFVLHGKGNGGTANFHMAVFGGPGTNLTVG